MHKDLSYFKIWLNIIQNLQNVLISSDQNMSKGQNMFPGVQNVSIAPYCMLL